MATGHNWFRIAVAGIESVAIDPFNPNEIVAADHAGGNFNISYDGGTTWSGRQLRRLKLSSTDIPWLASADSGKRNFYLDVGGPAFDPLVPNELWTSGGIGVWNSNVPDANFQWNTPVSWNDQSLGIEQLVANEIIVPPGGNPVLASWDRPFFYISDAECLSVDLWAG